MYFLSRSARVQNAHIVHFAHFSFLHSLHRGLLVFQLKVIVVMFVSGLQEHKSGLVLVEDNLLETPPVLCHVTGL